MAIDSKQGKCRDPVKISTESQGPCGTSLSKLRGVLLTPYNNEQNSRLSWGFDTASETLGFDGTRRKPGSHSQSAAVDQKDASMPLTARIPLRGPTGRRRCR